MEGLPEVTSKVSWEPLVSGQVIAGLTLLEQRVGQSGSPVWSVWTAEDANGVHVVLYALNPDINDKVHHRFVQGAKSMLRLTKSGDAPGVLRCYGLSRDRRALIAQSLSVGRATDISALRWSVQRSVEFFRAVCAVIESLHRHDIRHGCLRPGNILLDDDFNPILTEIGFLDIDKSLDGDSHNTHGYGAYAAPEITAGALPSVRSDIFSLGKILLFLLANDHPKSPPEAVPVLSDYKQFPEGLVRIARRCTVVNPDMRYATVKELVDDLARYDSPDHVGMALRIPTELKPTQETREMKDAQAAATEEEEAKPAFGMSARMRYAVIGSGILGIAISMLLAFFLAPHAALHHALLAIASISAALCTLSLPANPRHRHFSFIVVGIAFGLLVYRFNPIAIVATAGATRHLRASSVDARSASVRFLTSQGRRNFSNVDLRGADLSGADLNFSNFNGADLTNANLTRAMVQGIQLKQTSLAGANLTDVIAVDWDVAAIDGFEKTHCTNGTMLPIGWVCVDDHPEYQSSNLQRNAP